MFKVPESVIRKSINWCFTDQIMRAIAWDILSKNDKKSLQYQSIKAVMRLTMKKDIYGFLYFSVIFREPIYIRDFVDPKYKEYYEPYGFSWTGCQRAYADGKYHISQAFNRFRQKISKIGAGTKPQPIQGKTSLRKFKALKGDFKKIMRELRTDAEFMFCVIEQNYRRSMEIAITVEKHALKITPGRWSAEGPIAEFKTSDTEEYNLDLAEKFTRMAFSKIIQRVSLQMKGEGYHQWNSMQEKLNALINRLPQIVPRGGWRRAIRRRNVYVTYANGMYGCTTLQANFRIASEYLECHSEKYYAWGDLF